MIPPRLRAEHPNEPWLWRADWAQRAVRESYDVGAGCLWGFTILWNLFSLPLWFIVRLEWPMDPKTLLMAAFPAVGMLLLLLAIYQTLQRRKYGVSVCRIDRLPIPLGATMRGEIDVRLRDVPPAGFSLRLASLRRTVTGTGKNRSVNEHLLWQDEQTVTHGASPALNGLRVPFRFDIPWECEPATLDNPADLFVWRLQVFADVPGIDYRATFELPVFRTEGARDELPPRVHGPASWQPPPEITVTADAIVVRPSAGFGNWLAVILFYPVWFGALALLYQFGVPFFGVAFFGLFSLVLALFLLDFLLGRTTLRADRRSLTVHRTWLGIGRRRVIPTSEIVSLGPVLGTTVGNRGYHDVRAFLRDGRTRKVARHVRNRRDAEMLAARVGQSLGL